MLTEYAKTDKKADFGKRDQDYEGRFPYILVVLVVSVMTRLRHMTNWAPKLAQYWSLCWQLESSSSIANRFCETGVRVYLLWFCRLSPLSFDASEYGRAKLGCR